LPNTDPIHDQVNYLDIRMLDQLEVACGVRAFTIIQFLGDAVFIPAGAPHMVRNLSSCIKVALDFVSPQGSEQCVLITEQLRHLSDKHTNREDKLQIKNLIYHNVKKCLNVLSSGSSSGGRGDIGVY
jgi:lysine-specific demethylase 3